ncbi:hypothetical protein J14TS2_21530 [Bacillus sp. J14TS2]|nr:hypothetical protein J14TS2_21530 [Bacillus sp. J14TS2]
MREPHYGGKMSILKINDYASIIPCILRIKPLGHVKIIQKQKMVNALSL